MPQIRQQGIGNSGIFGLWEITESSEDLLQVIRLTAAERTLLDGFKNETRRTHWLSYRLLIRQMLGEAEVDVQYMESGKPFITRPEGYLSVSHSGRYSAVIFSYGKRVGIDIERIHEKIDRVSHKFLSARELSFVSNENRLQSLVTMWAAKESLYKLYGIPGLDFRGNLWIQDFPVHDAGSFNAEVRLKGKVEAFQLQYERIQDYMLVWVAD